LVLFATWSLLAAVALVCLLAFRLAPLAEALGGPEPVPLAEYHEGHLVTDLVALRSSMAPSKRLMRVVDYNAPETRFYNHFVGLWGLKTCREFRSIKMWSFKPSKGFTVQAVCPKHSRDLAPKFEVAWLEGAAHVSMSGKPSSKTVPLAPPLTEVATVADAWGGDASAIGDQ
jgi:hypothetical protein